MLRATAESKSASTSASKSTGPRTPEGKARSSMNALKHGLTATAALIPGEDPEEFAAFVADVVVDLEADGPVQRDLARRAAILMWKRQRLEHAEAQVFDELARNYVVGGEEGEGEQEEDDQAQVELPIDPDDPLKLVRFITADEFAGKERQLARLEHYDRRLGQQLDSTLRLLMKLQNRKQYQEQHARREAPQARSQGPRNDQTRPAAEGEADRPGPGRAEHSTCPPPPVPAQNELPPEPVERRETEPPERRPEAN